MSPSGEPAGHAPAEAPAPGGDCPAWTVEHVRGSVSDLLALEEPPTSASRLARMYTVEGPALVLGSTQKADEADARRAASSGVEVLRRRSGGGAVLLQPGRQVWADFFVAATDPLWHDDVTLATGWVGRLWASVCRASPAPGARSTPAASSPTDGGGWCASQEWVRARCSWAVARLWESANGAAGIGCGYRRLPGFSPTDRRPPRARLMMGSMSWICWTSAMRNGPRVRGSWPAAARPSRRRRSN